MTHKLVIIPFSLLLSRFGKMAHFSHSFCISIFHGTDMSNLCNTLNRRMLQHIRHDRQNGICDIYNSVTQVWKIHYNIVHTSYIQCKDNTGHFIMFVTTNIYIKKNQRIYLNGIVHSYRKTEKVFFFLTTRDVRCVHHGSTC